MIRLFRALAGFLIFNALVGCQTRPLEYFEPQSTVAATDSKGYQVDAPDVWGGDVRCSADACLLALIEHENGVLRVYELDRVGARLMASQSLSYHPDAAAWINEHLIAATVESTQTVDVFSYSDSKLTPVTRIPVGFQPRNVILTHSEEGRYELLATPYSGDVVAWIDLDERNPANAFVRRERWCKAPWNPVSAQKYPGGAGPGIVVACRDDRKLIARANAKMAEPRVLAEFSPVPSMVGTSPSGEWLYVAFELGGKNLRINTHTGVQQWMPASLEGSVAVVALSEDIIIWAEDSKIKLQKIDEAGIVLETRWLPTSGFSTKIQLIDIDRDGEKDLVVLNSAGNHSDILFGPLWENANP